MNIVIFLVIAVISSKFFGIKGLLISSLVGIIILALSSEESSIANRTDYSEQSTEELYDQLKLVKPNERKIILKEISKRLKESVKKNIN